MGAKALGMFLEEYLLFINIYIFVLERFEAFKLFFNML
jgi:hypothetical protein